MTQEKSSDFIRGDMHCESFCMEPEKQRPVLYDVDVAIAGSGLCSTFAAIAAGRCGARTLVIERFGEPGGNIGPGMMGMGSLYGEAETSLPGGLAGIAKEFVERLQVLRARVEPGKTSAVSYLAYDMMKAAGVEILLSAYASDPIVEDDEERAVALPRLVVRGLFVECKSGRMAVRAKVTIDGTGYAGIAQRAGAPIIPYLERKEEYAQYRKPKASVNEVNILSERHFSKKHPTYYNDTELICLIAGVDLEKFETFCAKEVPLSNEDLEWGKVTGMLNMYPRGLIGPLRKALEDGSYHRDIEPYSGVRIAAGRRFSKFSSQFRFSKFCSQFRFSEQNKSGGNKISHGDGIAKFYISCNGAVDATDAKQTSRIEAEMRALAFSTVTFYRNHAEGFENAYLLACPPFLGWRGGPHIDGEHTLTLEERHEGRKFDDVLYRNIHLGQESHGGEPSGFDVPYRAILPKNIDGLLVCGRGAAYLRRGHDPCAMRARPAMMVFGQCIGTAAAIAVLDNVTPKNVDIKKVQKRLVAEGIYLGDEERLRELGLTSPRRKRRGFS